MLLSVFSLVAAAATVSAQSSTIVPAPEVTNNPAGVSYVATLPEDKGTLRGSVTGSTGPGGKGVRWSVEVSGFPAEGGPFMYHIHEKPVPADGNCTATGAHLDPYKRGEVPPCDPTQMETCQTGDLSGKFGNFTGLGVNKAEVLDLYSSTNPESNAFFGDLSVVFHTSNKTRISCANFKLVEGDGYPVISSGYAMPTGTGKPSGTGSHNSTIPTSTVYSPAEPTQPAEPSDGPAEQPVNGGSRMMVAGAGVLAGAVALIL